MRLNFTVIIPTCQRSVLLKRTLQYIMDGTLPAELTQIIVVENGEQLGADVIIRPFRDRLPLEYSFSPPANKSIALNTALDVTTNDFVVFFDDDIRVASDTLAAYADLPNRLGAGFFAGGRCSVDYETAPPPWLLQFLPPSAKGWSLGDQLVSLTEPGALGFNWCAFKSQIRSAGGFNPERGPGTKSRGQETDMQVRLLGNGIPGYYVPAAHVWHFVPANRCNPEWALARTRQTAVYSGLELGKANVLRRAWHILKCRMRISMNSRRLKREPLPAEQFRLNHKIQRDVGILEGVAMPRRKPPHTA